MKKSILIPLAALALSALACGPFSVTVNVPRLTTGPTQTFTVNEALPDTRSATDVTLAMGAGELNLSGGGGLIEGSIQYNVADWRPTRTTGAGAVRLAQGQTAFSGIPGNDVVNLWDLKLGSAPMNLTITPSTSPATCSATPTSASTAAWAASISSSRPARPPR